MSVRLFFNHFHDYIFPLENNFFLQKCWDLCVTPSVKEYVLSSDLDIMVETM